MSGLIVFIHKRSSLEERSDFLTPRALEQCGVGCVEPADHYLCSHDRLVAVALHTVKISYWYTPVYQCLKVDFVRTSLSVM